MQDGIVPPMMPHQEAAVSFLRRCEGRALIADEMGLGKTRVIIEYLKQERIERTLVITTKSFLYGWKLEVEKWGGGEILSADVRENLGRPLTLYTYDDLSRGKIAPGSFECVVFDESHKLMNPTTARSRAARKLVSKAEKVICLTGTPQPNGQPRQLWHQMLIVGPEFLPWNEYRDRFCDPKEVWSPYLERYVWDYSGASNLQELKKLLKSKVLRRTKKLLKLPPLSTTEINTPLTLDRIEGEPWPTYAARLGVKKVPIAISLIKDLVEQGHKVVVFCNNIETRSVLVSKLDASLRYVYLASNMSSLSRSTIVQHFQSTDAVRVIVSTTALAAEGITLTAADAVVFVDLPWQPGTYDQAVARAHRKGQEKPVTVCHIISACRYDTIVQEALARKQAVTEELLDEDEVLSHTMRY